MDVQSSTGSALLAPTIVQPCSRPQVNPQQDSRLCTLPNELILNILEHALDDHLTITAKATQFKTSKEHDKYVRAFTTEFRTVPRFLQTCRVLRRLGRKDFYTRLVANAKIMERKCRNECDYGPGRIGDGSCSLLWKDIFRAGWVSSRDMATAMSGGVLLTPFRQLRQKQMLLDELRRQGKALSIGEHDDALLAACDDTDGTGETDGSA
ncbi:hypothetical protein LTR95_018089 [Oleoguttula sp. CCFEE 5521]